jgi:hypothetical protein
VTEFILAINQADIIARDPDYSAILTHLLSLKSLKKFTFGRDFPEYTFEIFEHLKVCNPAVETLTIMNPPQVSYNLNSLSKLFPCVTDLKMTWPIDSFDEQWPDDYLVVDLLPINSMKMIRKIEMNWMSLEILAQLELKELREFHVTEIVSNQDDDLDDDDRLVSWRKFIDNHSQLEVLHMPKCKMSVEELQCTLENLSVLKSLEFNVYGCDRALFFENPDRDIQGAIRKSWKIDCRKL